MIFDPLYAQKGTGYFANNRSELLKFIPDGVNKAFDVGCGIGNFGALLKLNKCREVWGIEPDEKSANEATRKLDKVITGIFDPDAPDFHNQKFDLICFNDVLEHLVNPAEILKQSKSLLAKNGYILASIPNLRYYSVIVSLLREKDFRYQKFGVMDETHLRFFTKNSIIRLFEENGYELITIEGINEYKVGIRSLLKFTLLKFQKDMRYPQFAILCKPKD